MPQPTGIRGYFLELAAESIGPLVSAGLGAAVAGPAGAVAGAAIGKAAGKAIEYFGPRIANVVFEWLSKKSHAEQRNFIESTATLTPAQSQPYAEQLIDKAAPNADPRDKAIAAAYLASIPQSIRRCLSRPEDRSGTTLPPYLVFRDPDDVLELLPAAPRFSIGDRPLLGSDLELVKHLGGGGFGEVWKAHNPRHPSIAPVVLKFLLDPATKSRALHHEASMVDQLTRQRLHPGIVPLKQTYLNNDPPCLEFEWVEGTTLTEWIVENHPITADNAIRVVALLADIVGYAHRLQPNPIIHRDLKPANILVAKKANGQPVFRITDFGISQFSCSRQQLLESAKTTGSRRVYSTAIQGAFSLLYASPQQIQGLPPDSRDDVHALGMIWYQLLTGDLSILNLPPEWKEELESRSVPPEHRQLLSNCISRRLENRPIDALILRDQLRPFLRHRSEIAKRSKPRSMAANESIRNTSTSANRKAPQKRVSEINCLRRYEGHKASVMQVSFDDDRIHFESIGDSSQRLWRIETGEEVSSRSLKIWTGHSSSKVKPIQCVGDLFILSDGRVMSKNESRADQSFPSGVSYICSHGEFFAVCVSDTIRIMKRSGMGRIHHYSPIRTLKAKDASFWFPRAITCADFAPSGDLLVSGDSSGDLILWHVDSGDEKARIRGYSDAVRSCSISPDGRRLMSVGGGEIKVWSLLNSELLYSSKDDSLLSSISCAIFTHRGRSICVGQSDGTVMIVDAATFNVISRLIGHGASVSCFTVSEAGELLSGSVDGTIRLWALPRS